MSQTVIKRGDPTPFLQDLVYEFDPQRGHITRLFLRGASQTLMSNLRQDYVRNGIACRLTYHQGDTASLETEDSTQQYTLDTWQIVGNEESRDGLSHPTVLALCSDDQIALIRQHLNNEDKSSDVFDTGGDLNALQGTAIPRFYSLQQRGSTEYRHGQYVLRHVTNAPSRWNSNIADFGVDQIYTPAQLLTEVQDSGLWIYPLPARLAYKIGHIPIPTFQAGYQWGWLKGASTETTAANNRIEIATEYVLEQWSTDYYAPY